MGGSIQAFGNKSDSFLPFSTAAQARTLAPARVVFSQKVSKGEPIVFINLNSIQSGFYIVQHLNSSGRIVSEKIIRL
jgi:hypothetical protein